MIYCNTINVYPSVNMKGRCKPKRHLLITRIYYVSSRSCHRYQRQSVSRRHACSHAALTRVATWLRGCRSFGDKLIHVFFLINFTTSVFILYSVYQHIGYNSGMFQLNVQCYSSKKVLGLCECFVIAAADRGRILAVH